MQYIEIDKNIHVPDEVDPEFWAFPFHDMVKGDSFIEPSSPLFPGRLLAAILWEACETAKQRYGGRYLVMQVEGGVRVWRIA